ncbi:MAG: hypothetical protein OXI87_13340 [Albidovulum sp.]|nr:hypothetical protein [Albidovulum sp.]
MDRILLGETGGDASEPALDCISFAALVVGAIRRPDNLRRQRQFSLTRDDGAAEEAVEAFDRLLVGSPVAHARRAVRTNDSE